MRIGRGIIPQAVFIFFASCCCTSIAAINIVNDGWKESPEVTTFPVGHPPAEIPQDIKDGAYAKPRVYVKGGRINGKYKNGCLTVTGMSDIHISGKTSVYLPDNVTSDLRDHEFGHDKLNRFEFDRKALKKFKAKMKGFEDMKFCASSSKAALAMAVAEKNKRFAQAVYAIKSQMQVLSDLYDSKEYTDHNLDDSMTPDEAVDDIKDRVTNKRNKKKPLRAGDNAKPAVTPPPALAPEQVCSDPNAFRRGQEGAILWDPHPAVKPFNLADPLFERLKVLISQLVSIGKMDDYRHHFSDATAIFYDKDDPNEIYLESSIYEITLEESNKPGFSQMLYGVMDVWVADINNAIASPWLSEMEMAAVEDHTCGFWVYFNDPILDEDGQMIADDASVPCEIFFAPIEAEPVPDVIQDNFDQYPTVVELQNEWMAMNGMVELASETAQGTGAMLFNYDTTTGPAEVTHMYVAPRDWQATGLTHLELWLDTDPNVPAVLENLNLVIHSGAGAQMINVLDGLPDMYTGISDVGYAAISMPIDSLMAAGVDVHSVMGIGLFVEPDPVEGGVISSFMIDEIRLAQAPSEAIPTADLDDDFMVTLSDLAIFAGQWLDGTP